MRRLVVLAALAAFAACSNSDPVKRPPTPPVVSTTTINFSTYLGNDLADVVRDVALDSTGNTYVVGGALSPNLLPGMPVRAFGGNAKEDAFVAKFNVSGQVVWWTFLGGSGPDRGHAIDVDSNDDVVIGGSAADGFPVTPGAVLTTFQGGAGSCDPTQLATNTTTVVPTAAKCDVNTTDPARDGFVAKLSGATGALLWATYFGSGTLEANAYEQASFCQPNAGPFITDDAITDFNDDSDPRTSVVRDVAVDPGSGEIYLTFSVRSSPAFFSDPDLVWATTNAGSDTQCDISDPDGPGAGTAPPLDGPAKPAVIRNLPPVILAALQNGDQPSAPGLDTIGGSGVDGMLAKLAPDGASLLWATYVGGRGNESDAMSVRLDSQGNPVVLLVTESSSPNFDRVASQDPVTKLALTTEPIVENGFDLTFNGVSDFYLAKYALNGPLIWATYLGGRSTELIENANLALRMDDTVVVAAQTSSTDFTPINGASFDPVFNGTTVGGGYFSGDCAIATIAPDGDALLGTTYYGGAGGDACSGVAFDSQNRIYVTGGTTSTDLPIRSGPHQAQRPGPFSGFLAVFSPDLTQLLHSGYFGGTGLGNANQVFVRSSAANSASVVFAGASEAAYPLTPSPGTPARGTVTAPPAHGVLSDVTIQIQ